MPYRLPSIRRPHVVALTAAALVAWVTLLQFPDDSSTTTSTAAATAAVTAEKRHDELDLERAAKLIVLKSNRFRREHDLNSLEVNLKLEKAAGYFASYIARTDRFTHTADGKTPSERAKVHGYDYCLVSENIAFVASSSDVRADQLANAIVEIWMKSPAHRANMLAPAVTEIGVAVAQSGKSGKLYGVQIFGRPKSSIIEFAIGNESEAPIGYTIDNLSYELPPGNHRTHQQCLPGVLRFPVPSDSKLRGHAFRPGNGSHYIVTGAANDLKIETK